MSRKKKKKSLRKRIFVFLFSLLLLLVLGGISFFYLVKWGAFGSVPGTEELKDIRNANASLVYSADQVLIGQFFTENRTNIEYEDLPQHLINALVATEDARFFEHEGVDQRSLFRVLIKSILLGDRSSGGGSTLTQQLAKNLYGRKNFSFLTLPVNKLKEMILASRIEKLYTKKQIIKLYLNTVSFSENTYGIEAGSRRFFSKHPARLKVEESAVLVGILKANTYYNPRIHPDHALKRRNVVLNQMERYGYLGSGKADSLKKLPLQIQYQNLADNSLAPYFLQQLKLKAKEALGGMKKPNGKEYSLLTDGLKVYTTLNYQMQKAAEKALETHLNYLQNQFEKHWTGRQPWDDNPEIFEQELQKSEQYQALINRGLSDNELEAALNKLRKMLVFYQGKDSVLELSIKDSVAHYLKLLHSSFLAMDPNSGAVLSWIGGRNYHFMPYDHVLAKRQAASTFKPLVYATALSQGIDPCDYIDNERRVYEEYEDWTPRNYDNQYGGFYSMKGALKKSVNVAAVQTIFNTGIENVIVTARKMGIDSKLPENPSIALGTGSVSLYEMVQAYSVFAAGRYFHQPYLLEKIIDADGNVLFKREEPEPEEVLSEETTRLMTAMLQEVVNEGTAQSLRTIYGLQNELAGKTGTAQNYTDGWFIGYNPSLVAGVWVGSSYPQIHFRSGTYGSGAATALPVFAGFFQELNRTSSLKNYSNAGFEELPPELQSKLDCPDYRDKNLMDKVLGVFKKKEGKKAEDKPGFFQRLFGKEKKKDN